MHAAELPLLSAGQFGLLAAQFPLARAMAMPTLPLWPLKNSQSARPAALVITFTRRAICDSNSPSTCSPPPPTPTGRMASKGSHGGWSDGHHGALGFHFGLGADDGDTAAAVVPALHVAPGERRSLGAAESGRRRGWQPGPRRPWPTRGDSCFAHSCAFEMAEVASRRVAMLAPESARTAR